MMSINKTAPEQKNIHPKLLELYYRPYVDNVLRDNPPLVKKLNQLRTAEFITAFAASATGLVGAISLLLPIGLGLLEPLAVFASFLVPMGLVINHFENRIEKIISTIDDLALSDMEKDLDTLKQQYRNEYLPSQKNELKKDLRVRFQEMARKLADPLVHDHVSVPEDVKTVMYTEKYFRSKKDLSSNANATAGNGLPSKP